MIQWFHDSVELQNWMRKKKVPVSNQKTIESFIQVPTKMCRTEKDKIAFKLKFNDLREIGIPVVQQLGSGGCYRYFYWNGSSQNEKLPDTRT